MSIQTPTGQPAALVERRIYTSDRPLGAWSQLRRLAGLVELFGTLVERDLRVRYRQTLLGFIWAVLPPVMLMVVFSLFLGRFTKLGDADLPYPVFVYVALLPWTFFSSSLASATTSISSNSALISKVAFPREILPWTTIATAGCDLLVGGVVLGGLLAFYGIPVTWTILMVIPLFALQVVLLAGLTLMLAAFNVHFRDVRHAVPLLLQIWMFASPVVYSARGIPDDYEVAYLVLNPIAALIDGYRRVVLRGQMPDPVVMIPVAILIVAIFFVCYAFFKRLEFDFADVA